MSKSKKRVLTVTGIFILIAATVLVCYILFRPKDDPGILYDNNASTGILPGIDIDERRKQLQEMLDRSMIAFSINTSPVFLNGKLLQVRIVINDTGEEIYASKYIKPGTYIESAKLDKVLEKGTYDATAYFSAFEEESAAYIGQTGAQIAITVQN